MNGPARVPRLSGVAAAWVLAVKDLKVALSYRVSFVLGHFTALLSIVGFYFVSRVVGDGSTVVGDPDEYFQFLFVGLAVGSMIETCVSSGVGAARRDQMQGTLEAVASLPVSSGTLGLGWLLYPTADGVVSIFLMTLVALPLGLSTADPSLVVLIPAAVLTVVLFSALGLFGASLVVAFQQGAGALTLVLTLLGMISGALFPTSVMPSWLQTVAEVSPLKHALDAVRAGAIDGASLADASGSLLTLAAFAAVLLPLSLLCLHLSLQRARRTGSLGKY